MSNIEGLQSGLNQKQSANERELQRERIFRELVLSHLFKTVREALEDADFSESEIDEFAMALAALPESDQSAVLSIPFEIREKLLNNYHKMIEEGKISSADVVGDILQKNKQNGFTLGYHLSNVQVLKQNGPKGETWNIKGTELDDRDNMLMAYYSEDYVNRYQKKSGKFLYVVRAEIGQESSHKRDLSNHWGRARLLSIIDECDMQEIEQNIDEEVKNENAAPLAGAAPSSGE